MGFLGSHWVPMGLPPISTPPCPPPQDLTDLPWGSPGGPQLSLSRGGRVVVIVLSSADVDSAAAAVPSWTQPAPVPAVRVFSPW